MELFPDSDADESGDPLRVIRSYLALAIQIGAPAYNGGDHRGCYEVYACTARLEPREMVLAPLHNKKLVRDLVTEIAPPTERFKAG